MSLGLGNLFWVVLQRDLLVALRRWSDICNPVIFFVLVVSLFRWRSTRALNSCARWRLACYGLGDCLPHCCH